jgi:hypothetical protein
VSQGAWALDLPVLNHSPDEEDFPVQLHQVAPAVLEVVEQMVVGQVQYRPPAGIGLFVVI